MDPLQRQKWLVDFLYHNCPRVSFVEALDLVYKFDQTERERYELAKVVGILSESKLGISNNGRLPDISGDGVAVQWAMKRVQYHHGSWSCGPSGGIPELIRLQEKEIEENDECKHKP